MHTTSEVVSEFSHTGLNPQILVTLEKLKLVHPTPIQAQTIPLALAGRDLIGIAQTGTGKTLAFGLPMLQNLEKAGNGLVIVPTRELALQVEESIKRVSMLLPYGLKTISLIGGEPISGQIRALNQRRPHIVIATPGRLQDHLNQGTISLDGVKLFVLDEADRLLDMGFAPQINKICQSLPKERQTMLFSATMAPEIAKLTTDYLTNPVTVKIASTELSANQIAQELCYVSKEGKTHVLQKLLDSHQGPVLVFSRTKHGAGKLMDKVMAMGHSAAEIHSNKSLGQRRSALEGFKCGRYRVLVATDVAARGIDVQDIALVINFDLPDAAEDYVHRIGRTGRAGKNGKAISLATHDQYKDVKVIERTINKPIPLSEHSDPEPSLAHAYTNRPATSNRRPFNKRPSGSGQFAPSRSRFQSESTAPQGKFMSRRTNR